MYKQQTFNNFTQCTTKQKKFPPRSNNKHLNILHLMQNKHLIIFNVMYKH